MFMLLFVVLFTPFFQVLTYVGGPKKNEIFSWAIDLFKELQKIH